MQRRTNSDCKEISPASRLDLFQKVVGTTDIQTRNLIISKVPTTDNRNVRRNVINGNR